MKYKTQNGWTKEKMKEQIKKRNNGTVSLTEKSDSAHAICAYRGVNNNACVAGCFIPDKLYTPTLEGLGVQSTSFINMEKVFPLSNPVMSLLQYVHDNFHPNLNSLQKLTLHQTLFNWIDENVEDSV